MNQRVNLNSKQDLHRLELIIISFKSIDSYPPSIKYVFFETNHGSYT